MRQISNGNKYLVQDDDLWVDYAEDNPVSGRMVKFMLSENFLLTQGNQVEYFPMGEDAFESIFHELEKAEKFILIDFFIVAEGALWDKMHEILKRKIEEGVEVKFMYDDFGAAIRTRKYFKQILEHEGFEVWEACGHDKEHVDYLKYKVMSDVNGDTWCQVISDGPANNPKNPIESIYNQMIMYSDQYLYITTPYLIIEDYMQQSLIEAVRRGVDVRIVTPNIPDKKYAKMLTNYNYGSLLKGGVRIFEYTPGFIHAKQILTEDAAIVGTINMDYRSFYLHYENGVWMSGEKIQNDIHKDFEKMFEESREIKYEEWLNRPVSWKLIQPLLNLFATLF